MSKYKFRQRGPSPLLVSDEIQTRIISKVKLCLQLVEGRHGLDLPIPTIDYSMVGATSGQANLKTWAIKLNSILLMENLEEMINDTVPHEVAHLAVHAVYPNRRVVHGPEWATMMILFGLEPTRCHNYDTTNSSRKRRAWTYICACEHERGKNKTHLLGAKRHRKQQAQGLTYYCRDCRAFLVLKD